MNKFLLSTLALCVLTAFAYSQAVLTPGKAGEIVVVEKAYANSNIDGYTLYLPQSYDELNKRFAVLIFLHGGLGVGGEVVKVNEQPLPEMLLTETDMSLERNQYLLDSFVVVCPHMVEGQFYQNESAFREMVNEVLAAYTTDPNRVYLTGLSRGGHGTWGLAGRMPDVFAAAVPIAGSDHGLENPASFGTFSVWAIHNTDDEVVGYTGSSRAVKAIEKAAGKSFFEFLRRMPRRFLTWPMLIYFPARP